MTTDIAQLQSFFKDKRILIIEDDAFLGGILYRYIVDMKIPVDLLTSGEGVIESINKNPPSIIMLDIFLPGINGLDLLESIRKNKNGEHIPVLVVSNTDQLKDRQRAESMGAQVVLKAMVTPANILDRLYQLLSKKA